MANGYLIVMQLIGVVFAGGFIGEYYRAAHYPDLEMFSNIFIANFLAGGFLSFLIGYFIYNAFENKFLSITISGLLSFQEVKEINSTAKKIIKLFIDGELKNLVSNLKALFEEEGD